VKDPEKRIALDDALKHPWFDKLSKNFNPMITGSPNFSKNKSTQGSFKRARSFK